MTHTKDFERQMKTFYECRLMLWKKWHKKYDSKKLHEKFIFLIHDTWHCGVDQKWNFQLSWKYSVMKSHVNAMWIKNAK